MGKIKHVSRATVSKAEFEADDEHSIGGLTTTNIVRTATYVVAANDAPAHVKAQGDYPCDGTADQVDIQTAIDV